MSLFEGLSIRKVWESFCNAMAEYPPAIPGATLTHFVSPVKRKEPATVTLANGQVVPAPVEGVNVYNPSRDEDDICAEVALYVPLQQKIAIPHMSQEEAARWCP